MQNIITRVQHFGFLWKIKCVVQNHKGKKARLNLLSLNPHLAKDIGLEKEHDIAQNHEFRHYGHWM